MFPFKLIDLTHPINTEAPTWEGDCGFNMQLLLDYADCTSSPAFRVQTWHMHAGLGTHMDAPAHCIPNGKTIDKLELEHLISPCVVIDVAEKAHAHFVLSVDDVFLYEKTHGSISDNSVVLIHTGWGRYWPQLEQYHHGLQFPSVSLEAARYLLEKNIRGLGIDTLSADLPDSGYPVHQMILGQGKYLIENVANAHVLPPKGSFILTLPLPIQGATESPIRLIGLVS